MFSYILQDKLEFAEEYSKHPYGGEIQYRVNLRVASDSFRAELDSRVGILKEKMSLLQPHPTLDCLLNLLPLGLIRSTVVAARF